MHFFTMGIRLIREGFELCENVLAIFSVARIEREIECGALFFFYAANSVRMSAWNAAGGVQKQFVSG